MIARRLSFFVLTVAFCIALTGCRRAVQPPEGNKKSRPIMEKKGGRKVMQAPMDDDTLRINLVMTETVQSDLRLTADQIEKLRDYGKAQIQRNQEFFAQLRKILPPSQRFTPEEYEARNQRYKKLAKDFGSKDREFRSKALAILTHGQTERLKQIQFQVYVPVALTRPEIIKAIGISEEQLARIRVLRDRDNQRQLALWPDLRGLKPEQRRQKQINFVKSSHEAAAKATKYFLDVLTPEQRAEFEKIQGNKINLARLRDELIPKGEKFRCEKFR